MTLPRTLLVSVLPLLLAGSAGAQAWSAFRGADGGRAPALELPDELKTDAAAWRVELPGAGNSSPVLWKERVFLTSLAPEGDARLVSCHATRNGETLWTTALPFASFSTHRLNGFVTSTPALDAEHVYVVGPDGDRLRVHALDHAGEVQWTRELGPYRARHGGGASPLVVGDRLVVSGDSEAETSFLVGLDTRTGLEIWRRPRTSSRAAFATPVLLSPESVLFASTSHGLTCLDPATGALQWELTDLFEQRVVATPVVADDLVLLFAGKGGGGTESAAVKLPFTETGGEPGSDAEPRLEYRLRRSLPYVPTPVARDGLVFLLSDAGIASAVQGYSGEVLWSERLGGEFFGSPVLAGDRAYVLTKGGELVVFAAGREFAALGRVDLGEPSNATPAIADGVLYLRTERHLWAFAADSAAAR